VPAANREAAVQAQAMHALGVKKLYVADDGGQYGKAIALAVADSATVKGITAVRGSADVQRFNSSGADALFIGASDKAAAKRLFDGVATASPRLRLFGPSALSDDIFVASLTPAAQRSLEVSQPGFMQTGRTADLTLAAREFIAAFKARYNRDPGQSAFFGYAAMEVVLDALRHAASNAGNRSEVVRAFFNAKNRSSVLGTYSIDVNGDTSLAPYIFSHIKAGKLVPFESLQG
jgi:branched-chain amino acid transport system substrate-binding protein